MWNDVSSFVKVRAFLMDSGWTQNWEASGAEGKRSPDDDLKRGVKLCG